MKRLLPGLAFALLLVACGGSAGADDDRSPTGSSDSSGGTEIVVIPADATPAPDAAGVAPLVVWKASSPTGNDTYIYGELSNTASTDATNLGLEVTLRGTDDGVISVRDECVVNDRLTAGATSGFLCTFPLVPAKNVEQVQVKVTADAVAAGSVEPGGFTTELRIDDLAWTANEISGNVTNTGDAPANDVKIVVVGYTSDGAVMSVMRVGIGEPLPAGESAPFLRQMNDVTVPFDGSAFPPDRFTAYVSATVDPADS